MDQPIKKMWVNLKKKKNFFLKIVPRLAAGVIGGSAGKGQIYEEVIN